MPSTAIRKLSMRNFFVWWASFLLLLCYCLLAVWHRRVGSPMQPYFFPYVYVVLPVCLLTGVIAFGMTARTLWVKARSYPPPKDSLIQFMGATLGAFAGWFKIGRAS